MATGLKANNVCPGNPAYSWEDLYAINGGSLTNATRENFKVLVLDNAPPICFYSGSGALTTSEFASLPLGSIIFGIIIQKIYFKQTDNTDSWKYASVTT